MLTVNMDVVCKALLWSAALNYILLISWFVIFLLPHEWIFRICSRAFRVTVARFDEMNLQGIIIYKLGILLFNLMPGLALLMVR
jgi:hypothetical protein